MASAPQVSTQHARVLRIALAGTLSPFFSEALKRHAVSLVELDESASVDAVILLPGSDANSVYARMAHGGNLLAAVIDLSGAQSARADFVAPTAGPDSLARGIETAMSLREKCAVLAAIPNNDDRVGLTVLALSITRECDIAPRLNPDRPSMFDYPLLAGIADQRLGETVAGQVDGIAHGCASSQASTSSSCSGVAFITGMVRHPANSKLAGVDTESGVKTDRIISAMP